MAPALHGEIQRLQGPAKTWRPERSISTRCCRIEVAGRGAERLRPRNECREPLGNRAVHFAQPGQQEERRTQGEFGSTVDRSCRFGSAAQATCTLTLKLPTIVQRFCLNNFIFVLARSPQHEIDRIQTCTLVRPAICLIARLLIVVLRCARLAAGLDSPAALLACRSPSIARRLLIRPRKSYSEIRYLRTSEKLLLNA